MGDAAISRWLKTDHVASWILIGLFVFMAGAHVVLTVLFYTGVDDTGVGYVLDWEWPAWLITIIDATIAGLLWFAHQRGTEQPRLGVIMTIAAAIMAMARAAWMVLVPILLIITIAGSVTPLARSQETSARK